MWTHAQLLQLCLAAVSPPGGGRRQRPEPPRAALDFEKLVAMVPEIGEFHGSLAVACYGSARYRDAARECREALARKPAASFKKS